MLRCEWDPEHGYLNKNTWWMRVSSPDAKKRHGTTSCKECKVRIDLKLSVTSHAAAEEVRCDQVHQSHIQKDTCWYSIKHTLHSQCCWTVVIVRWWNPHSDRNSYWSCDSKEESHECSRTVTESSLQSEGWETTVSHKKVQLPWQKNLSTLHAWIA